MKRKSKTTEKNPDFCSSFFSSISEFLPEVSLGSGTKRREKVEVSGHKGHPHFLLSRPEEPGPGQLPCHRKQACRQMPSNGFSSLTIVRITSGAGTLNSASPVKQQ